MSASATAGGQYASTRLLFIHLLSFWHNRWAILFNKSVPVEMAQTIARTLGANDFMASPSGSLKVARVAALNKDDIERIRKMEAVESVKQLHRYQSVASVQ